MSLIGPVRGTVVALCIALLALSGCAHKNRQLQQSSPDVLYKKARKALNSYDYNSSIKTYEQLTARFPFTDQARQARLDLIYAYYRAGEKESATDAAETFIRENPTHPRVDYAWYIKGLVDFERPPNALEKLFRVDLSQRPPINAKKSFDAFQQLIEKYPHSQYVGDAQQRMVYLRNRLADFELHVALYYMRRGAYVGALNRAKYCVENYDGAPAVKGSMRVIVAAYYDLKMVDLAKDAERVYADNYPGPLKDLEPKKHWYQRIL